MVETRQVFLSHAWDDKPIVHRIAAELYERGISAWIDEAEIRTGESIVGAINAGLENCEYFAAVLTPNYFESASGWTDAEWHASLFSDPDNKSSKFIPLLATDCPHIPILLRHLLRIDIRGDSFDFGMDQLEQAACGRVVTPVWSRGVETSNGSPTRSSVSAILAPIVSSADAIEERLSCNLAPMLGIPSKVYSSRLVPRNITNGAADYVNKKKLVGIMENHAKESGRPAKRIPPFRLSGDRVYSFYDVGKPGSPFLPVLRSRRVEKLTPKNMISNQDDQKILVSLLNLALQRHCRSLGLLGTHESGRGWRYFFSPRDRSGARRVGWSPGRKRSERTVAKPLDANRPRAEWLHAGAYLDVCEIGEKFFLKIRPTWVVTEDGRQPKSGTDVGKIVSRWTNSERNLSLLYHVRFWTTYLAGGQTNIEIAIGQQQLVFSKTPAQLRLNVGIRRDQNTADALLDTEARLFEAEEFDLVERAWTYVTEEDWDIEEEPDPEFKLKPAV